MLRDEDPEAQKVGVFIAFDYSLFFFFQAEDGIRDPLVTGVQTCALPICSSIAPELDQRLAIVITRAIEELVDAFLDPFPHRKIGKRRVGKECRSRWSPYQ